MLNDDCAQPSNHQALQFSKFGRQVDLLVHRNRASRIRNAGLFHMTISSVTLSIAAPDSRTAGQRAERAWGRKMIETTTPVALPILPPRTLASWVSFPGSTAIARSPRSKGGVVKIQLPAEIPD